MQTTALLEQLSASGNRLADGAEATGLGALVPSCPGWTVGDLVQHLCRVHAWAVHTVRGRSSESFAAPQSTPDLLVADYRRGLEALVKVLQSAREGSDPAAASSRQFWIRRMAHETTVHRLDVELAGDTGMFEVPAAFGADGIDELLHGFAPSGFLATDLPGGRTVTLMPLDVNRAWTLTVGPSGVRAAEVASDHADLTVAGMASDLYRWAWNRAPDEVVSLTGSASLADLWHERFAVTSR